MKKVFRNVLLSLCIVAMAIQFVSAQNGFSYQAVVRNANGEFLSGKNVTMRITLSHAGNDYYQESHSLTTGSNGELSLTVGKGNILSGSFSSVPWNTMDVTLKSEISVNGTDYIRLAEEKIKPMPYAFYAASAEPATTIEAAKNAADDEALFSVKDENGNLVFAVYPNLVQVFVDNANNSSKAMRSSFAVSGRHSATKDGSDADLFTVNPDGTQVFIDGDESKAMRSSFAVSGRHSAAKDDAAADILAVGADGTHIYVYEDETKAMRSSFAVSGRHSASKDSLNDDFFSVSADGTQVFVDTDESKAMRSSFAVSGRHSATKDGASDDYLFVGADGTTVYVDGGDDKAMRSSFAVSGRHSATKGGADSQILSVDADGTQIFVDSDESKAMRSSFAVSKRHSATKAGEEESLFAIDNESGTHIYIDDEDAGKAMRSSFAVSGRHSATKDGDNNYVSITAEHTNFTVNTQSAGNAFSIVGLATADTLVSVSDLGFNIERKVSASGNTSFVDAKSDDGDNTLVVNMLLAIQGPVFYYGYYYGDYVSKVDLSDWLSANNIDATEMKCVTDSSRASSAKGDMFADLYSVAPVGDYSGNPDLCFRISAYRNVLVDTVVNVRFNESENALEVFANGDRGIYFLDYNNSSYHYSGYDLHFLLQGTDTTIPCHVVIDSAIVANGEYLSDVPKALERLGANYADGVETLYASCSYEDGSLYYSYENGTEYMYFKPKQITGTSWLKKTTETASYIYSIKRGKCKNAFYINEKRESMMLSPRFMLAAREDGGFKELTELKYGDDTLRLIMKDSGCNLSVKVNNDGVVTSIASDQLTFLHSVDVSVLTEKPKVLSGIEDVIGNADPVHIDLDDPNNSFQDVYDPNISNVYIYMFGIELSGE